MNIKTPASRKASALVGNRYEARFVNGVHTVFDTERFGHGVPLGTAKQAAQVADDLNKGKLQWAA
jgi:hypothetical protein